MELGCYTFADVAVSNGKPVDTNKRFKELLEEIQLADQLGLDVFGLGEHHRPEYVISSPATVLAAAAVLTKNIKLSSTVTVLSSDDPVRVYQQFATVDQLSDGRAELMVGRGSFIESFPLFGYDLNDYDALFEEKLELLVKINNEENITWRGKFTQTIPGLPVYPKPFLDKLALWVAVGGTPASAQRAAKFKLPMALAIIGGMPKQFAPFTQLYKTSAIEAGMKESEIQLGINSHVFVSDDSQKAADDFYPSYAAMMNKIGKERGWSPLSKAQFDNSRGKQAALVVGSTQEVIDKILYEHELFGNTRFLAQMSVGLVDHKKVLHSMELFGTKVAPEVRKYTAAKITNVV